MSKFQNVPIEPDTLILGQEEVMIQDVIALKQQWFWDGVAGESLIFDSQDIRNMNDEDVLKFINNNWEEIISQATFKRNEKGYCFVNFNFVTY
jgi:hypothetical protein